MTINKLSHSFVDTSGNNFATKSNIQDKKPDQIECHNFISIPDFLFPYQRRARSNSPQTDKTINLKIAETLSNNAKLERSWSNSLENNNESLTPVVANTSFVIGKRC